MTKEQVENVRKWIEALRSGKYEQGQNKLFDHCCFGDVTARYCCLGVLAEISPNATKHASSYKFIGSWHLTNTLIPDDWWIWNTGLALTHMYHCIDLNDRDGYTFKQIADYLEAQLPLTSVS